MRVYGIKEQTAHDIKNILMTTIERGNCQYIKNRERQSLKCANCRYNRVVNIQTFVRAAHTSNKTAGSVCVYKDKRQDI